MSEKPRGLRSLALEICPKRFGAFAKQALWSMFTPRIDWLFEAHVMRYNMKVCTTCDSLHLVPVECNPSGRAVSMCKSKSPFHILLSGFCFLFCLFFFFLFLFLFFLILLLFFPNVMLCCKSFEGFRQAGRVYSLTGNLCWV